MEYSDLYKRLEDKVDDHDKSLTLVTKAVEDINKNLSRFADSSEQMREDMTKHWHMQDRTMDKLEAILSKLSEGDSRFKQIENNQVNGCPYVKNFERLRNEQLKHYDSLGESLTTATKHNRNEIEELTSKADVSATTLKSVNIRLSKTELWQDNVMKFLVGKSIVLIGILITVIWGMMK